MRVRGRGVSAAGHSPAGDLLVTVDVTVPTELSDEQRAAMEALAQEPERPRQGGQRVSTPWWRRASHHETNPAVYVISVAAALSGMHPQTLRNYERTGLLDPSRYRGGVEAFLRG